MRRRRAQTTTKWHLDQVFLKIKGRLHYLWRVVDQKGHVLDILVQSRPNKAAAKKFFGKLLKGCHYVGRVLITDKPASYGETFKTTRFSVSTHPFLCLRLKLTIPPRGWLSIGPRVALPLISNAAWGLLILLGLPRVFAPLPALMLGLPDLGPLLVGSAVVALGWSIVRTVLAYVALRTPLAPPAVSVVAKAS